MIWYIDEDLTTGLNDGSSWTNAFQSFNDDVIPSIGGLSEDSTLHMRSNGTVDVARSTIGLTLNGYTFDMVLESGSLLYGSTSYTPVFNTTLSGGSGGILNLVNFTILQGSGSGYGIGLSHASAGGTVNLFNPIVRCILTKNSDYGIYAPSPGTNNIYGGVIVNCDVGIGNETDGVLNIYNTYISSTATCYNTTGTASNNLTTCGSSDETGSSGLQNITYDNTLFTNTSVESEDFHLVPGSSLIGSGTVDISLTDFEGDLWGTPRDIGVYNYSTGGSIHIPVNTDMNGGFMSMDGGL